MPYKSMILFSILLLMFLLSCKNDDTDSSMNNHIYYSFNESEKQLLNADNIVHGSVGDTFTLYLNSINDPILYFNAMTDSAPVDVIDNRNGEYTINFMKTAWFSVIVKYYSEKNSTEEKSFRFYINVQAKDFTYQILNNTCIIDIENDSLKNSISTEIKNSYIPMELSSYKLSYEYYDTTKETANGSLVYSTIGVENKNYEGTFTKEKNFINMQYNGLNFYFTILNQDSVYYLKQDLTDIFKTKYPGTTINKISISSKVLIK